MKRKIVTLLAASLVAAAAAGTATVAQAFPNRTSACSGCHSVNSGIVVSATQTSNDGANATYAVSVSNTYGDGVTGWAVFDGTANIRNGYGAGTFSVPVGKSYTVWGVAGSGGRGSRSIVINPVAPPPPPPPADTAPPVVGITAPADGAIVSGTVAISAAATDADSGVARVEFRVDGMLVGMDTTAPYADVWDSSVAAPGPHAIEATAIDNAGLSSATSIAVSIASPPPPPPVDGQTSALTVTVTSADGAPVAGAKVVAKNVATGVRSTGVTGFDGTAVFSELAYGDYSLVASARGHRRATATVLADSPAESLSVVLSGRLRALKSDYRTADGHDRDERWASKLQRASHSEHDREHDDD